MMTSVLLASSVAFSEEKPAKKEKPAWQAITEEQVKSITYEDCESDNGFVGPITNGLDHLSDDARKRFDEWCEKLDDWKPGQEADFGQRVRNYICLATIADMTQGEFEGETAYVIFERIKKEIPKDDLIKICAWIVLKPEEGKAVTSAADLGYNGEMEEKELRERATVYAMKLLGRLLGKLPVKP